MALNYIQTFSGMIKIISAANGAWDFVLSKHYFFAPLCALFPPDNSLLSLPFYTFQLKRVILKYSFFH